MWTWFEVDRAARHETPSRSSCAMGPRTGTIVAMCLSLTLASLGCNPNPPIPTPERACSLGTAYPSSITAGTESATVGVRGVACAFIDSSAVATGQNISMSQETSRATTELLSETGAVYGLTSFASHQVKLALGASAPNPSRPVKVSIAIPMAPQQNATPELVDQIVEPSDLAVLDQFEVLPARTDGNALTASLPGYAFSQRVEDNGAYEAILGVGWPETATTASNDAGQNSGEGPPSLVLESAGAMTTNIDGNPVPCPSGIGSPIEGWGPDQIKQHIRSSFGQRGDPLHPGQSRPHYGVDIAVPDGTSIVSPISGTVEVVNFQAIPPSGHSWGEYIVIDGTDATVVLAHLEGGPNNQAPPGQSDPTVFGISNGTHVAAGQSVALSDSTGGVTGPHLHMEVVQHGHGYKGSQGANPFKVDPLPCISTSRFPTGFTVQIDGRATADEGCTQWIEVQGPCPVVIQGGVIMGTGMVPTCNASGYCTYFCQLGGPAGTPPSGNWTMSGTLRITDNGFSHCVFKAIPVNPSNFNKAGLTFALIDGYFEGVSLSLYTEGPPNTTVTCGKDSLQAHEFASFEDADTSLWHSGDASTTVDAGIFTMTFQWNY